jgi:uncharacterized protein YecE (DUF72 family)
MQWYAGTSGYSYKPWKGPFYPSDLPDDQMLAYYAERLPAVEINNTFYRMPRTSVLEKWADSVPSSFRFVIKASRRITHIHRLKDAGEPTGYLLNAVKVLGDRLGALLFQLPPNLPCDRDRLSTFLDLLPEGTPAAFEFRHPSWVDPDVRAMLAERGAALCIAEGEDDQPLPELPESPWLYLRLRRPDYTDADLRGWIERGRASGAQSGFVFFKHEDDGAGPAMAARFLALANRRPARAPKAAPASRRRTSKRA